MKRHVNWIIALGILCLAFIASAPQAQAAPELLNRKISGVQTSAEASDLKVSPDGRQVVYLVDFGPPHNQKRLYRAPVDGSAAPVLLNLASMPNILSVSTFEISPDGSRVAYLLRNTANGAASLYSVPLMGGPPVRLNSDLVNGGKVRLFQISPDSSRIVYSADQDTDEVVELWSVPIAGGAATRLNSDLVAGGDVTAFQISPDNNRVVYIADAIINNLFRLFSVPLTGGASTTFASGAPLTFDVKAMLISPDSRRVLYLADRETAGMFDLWSVPLGGGESVRLNSPLPNEGLVLGYTISISPDSKRVVFIANVLSKDIYRAFSVSIIGGDITNLTPGLPFAASVFEAQISPNGSRVVYMADRDKDNMQELYSVPLKGGAHTRLNADLPDGGFVSGYQISPDSRSVVYRAEQETNGTSELYRAPIGGGNLTKLSGALVASGNVEELAISPDSGTVIYYADQEIISGFAVFATSDAPPSVTVSGPTGPLAVGEHALKVSLSAAKLLGSANVDLSTFIAEVSTDASLVDADLAGGSDAVAGEDYLLENAKVQFAPGQTSKQVTITVLNNPERTAARTLKLYLANASGATIGQPNFVELTLAPNDQTVNPTTPTATDPNATATPTTTDPSATATPTTTGPSATPTGPTATATTGPAGPTATPTTTGGPATNQQRVYVPLVIK